MSFGKNQKKKTKNVEKKHIRMKIKTYSKVTIMHRKKQNLSNMKIFYEKKWFDILPNFLYTFNFCVKIQLQYCYVLI